MWENVGKIVEIWDFSHNVGNSGSPGFEQKKYKEQLYIICMITKFV
jgi:hypothetical protein